MTEYRPELFEQLVESTVLDMVDSNIKRATTLVYFYRNPSPFWSKSGPESIKQKEKILKLIESLYNTAQTMIMNSPKGYDAFMDNEDVIAVRKFLKNPNAS